LNNAGSHRPAETTDAERTDVKTASQQAIDPAIPSARKESAKGTAKDVAKGIAIGIAKGIVKGGKANHSSNANSDEEEAAVAGQTQAASFASRPPTTNSIFSEMLDWLLVPLLVMWPISFIAAYFIAFDIANQPYDRALEDTTRALIDQVTYINNNVVIALPNPETNILRADDVDIISYRITADDGTTLAGATGDSRISVIPLDEERYSRNTIHFRDILIDGQEARCAFVFTSLNSQTQRAFALVQVAETKNKRNQLATRIAAFAMALLFIAMPTAVLLLWFGLTRGLRPVLTLRERFNNRLPNDLSAIDPHEVPDELRPMIATLNRQLAKVRGNLQAQQRFVADAAHQMRTPLAGLKTQAELALSLDQTEQTRNRLLQITSSADRAAHMINQLLALARADNRTNNSPNLSDDTDLRTTPLELIDLGQIAREATVSYVDSALEKSIDLGYEDVPGRHRVQGDAALLRELINNLIDNAIKYTPVNGQITVRILRDSSHTRSLLLQVEDTGIGIPPGDREQVFERFYRVLGTGEAGSGLGLAIVRSIALFHNASVTVSGNEKGQGSVFEVRFVLAFG
jgi:two-component system, OmpR family, sensor histidine kinase TctE